MPITIHILNVGQGNGVILDLGGDTFAVVDACITHDGHNPVLEFLRAQPTCKRLAFVALSHWHRDHCSGLPAVIDEFTKFDDEFSSRIDKLVTPFFDLPFLLKIMQQQNIVLDDIERSGLPGLEWQRQQFERRSRWQAAQAKAVIWSDANSRTRIVAMSPTGKATLNVRKSLDELVRRPPTSATERKQRLFRHMHPVSMALLIEHGNDRAMLLGDLAGDQWQAILADVVASPELATTSERTVNFALLSHHGSDKDNPDIFFDRMLHDDAIVAVSAGGRYQHPHPEAMRRVKRRKPPIGHGCTNLGELCLLLQSYRGFPTPAHIQKVRDAYAVAGPRTNHARCHDTITVELSGNDIRMTTQQDQPNCPFNRP